MKRFIALILVLMLFLTSCDTLIGDIMGVILPDSPADTENNDSVPGDSEDNKPEDNRPDDSKPETPGHSHTFKAAVTIPTCVSAGFTTYSCLTCDYSYVSDETLPLGHNYETSVTEPTCKEVGYSTYTCTLCGDSYVENGKGALGHRYDVTVTASKRPFAQSGKR